MVPLFPFRGLRHKLAVTKVKLVFLDRGDVEGWVLNNPTLGEELILWA